jgi:hypothetical protein
MPSRWHAAATWRPRKPAAPVTSALTPSPTGWTIGSLLLPCTILRDFPTGSSVGGRIIEAVERITKAAKGGLLSADMGPSGAAASPHPQAIRGELSLEAAQ